MAQHLRVLVALTAMSDGSQPPTTDALFWPLRAICTCMAQTHAQTKSLLKISQQ